MKSPVLGGALAALVLLPRLYAQLPPEVPGSPPPGGDAIRPMGPSLFPLYDHYLRTADATEVRTVFFLYHATDAVKTGDTTRLLFPLYYWQRQSQPPDRRLYLFPLLFLHRSSEEESFDYALPFYFDRRTPERVFQLLFPLWWHTADLAERISIHRFFFPLVKIQTEEKNPASADTRSRFGLRYLLEIFESRFAPGVTKLYGFNLFNWKSETDSGLPLMGIERTVAPDGVIERRSHLFPLYWQGETPERNYLAAGPFYGFFQGGDIRREYYTPLLWRARGEGGFRSLLLFPFYHRATRDDPALSYFASYPFFGYERTAEQRRWSILLLLYRNTHHFERNQTTQSVLYPLGYFDVAPDGITGHRRLLPFWYDDFDASRRIRFSFPLYWNYQSRSQQDVVWDFSLVLPTYLGWGAPRDYFATGFPLYWRSTTGPRTWQILIPLFYHQKEAASSAFYSLPLTRVNLPSQKATSVLAGGATYRSFYDFQGAPEGWAVDLLWWLWGAQSRQSGWQARFLPLVWMGRDGEDRSLLLFPLFFRQWGPTQSQNYFFPVYGQLRTSDGRLYRDFYALGAYIHTVEFGEDRQPVRNRDDLLWSLASFQTDTRLHLTHRRVLPFLWQTRSVNEDRTIVFPFSYAHRINFEDETYRLMLVLGNLYLQKSVERERPRKADDPPGTPGRELVSQEKGILWPVSCWGQDNQGNPFEWALPFYFHSLTPTEENRSFFPFVYYNRENGAYHGGYFRYFFLADYEKYEGGNRLTLGQLLFDWKADVARQERRIRLFYPVLEARFWPDGYSYQVTPLMQGTRSEEGGKRESSHFLFPFYFRGATQLKKPDGGYTDEASHFYLFPLYGVSRKSLKTERDFLIPFVHLRRSIDGFAFHLRPIFFLRREPEEFSVRLWPLHSHESGEGSGEWWVSKYLYFSKLALRRQSFSYRLDPLLVTLRSGGQPPKGLGGLIDYRHWVDDEGPQTSWRALPLAYGYSRPKEAGSGFFPLVYARDFGARDIDRAVPWRFFYLFNRLRGAGERHWSFLWKLLEYSDRPDRPAYHEFRMLQEFVVDFRSETARQFTLNPFFNYIRDDSQQAIDWSVLFSIYRYRKKAGEPQHTLFWVFRW